MDILYTDRNGNAVHTNDIVSLWGISWVLLPLIGYARGITKDGKVILHQSKTGVGMYRLVNPSWYRKIDSLVPR